MRNPYLSHSGTTIVVRHSQVVGKSLHRNQVLRGALLQPQNSQALDVAEQVLWEGAIALVEFDRVDFFLCILGTPARTCPFLAFSMVV